MVGFKIFKHKARYSRKINWIVESPAGYWGSYPTLKRAKNEVLWAKGVPVRSFDLDFSK